MVLTQTLAYLEENGSICPSHTKWGYKTPPATLTPPSPMKIPGPSSAKGNLFLLPELTEAFASVTVEHVGGVGESLESGTLSNLSGLSCPSRRSSSGEAWQRGYPAAMLTWKILHSQPLSGTCAPSSSKDLGGHLGCRPPGPVNDDTATFSPTLFLGFPDTRWAGSPPLTPISVLCRCLPSAHPRAGYCSPNLNPYSVLPFPLCT